MVEKRSFSRAISSVLTADFLKWFSIGLIVALATGATIGLVVQFHVLFT